MLPFPELRESGDTAPDDVVPMTHQLAIHVGVLYIFLPPCQLLSWPLYSTLALCLQYTQIALPSRASLIAFSICSHSKHRVLNPERAWHMAALFYLKKMKSRRMSSQPLNFKLPTTAGLKQKYLNSPFCLPVCMYMSVHTSICL